MGNSVLLVSLFVHLCRGSKAGSKLHIVAASSNPVHLTSVKLFDTHSYRKTFYVETENKHPIFEILAAATGLWNMVLYLLRWSSRIK